jgi:autoinducer 2-degrading protein
MIVRGIRVVVKENAVEDFKQATVANHKGSIQEPGVLRFDVLQSADDPRVFLLYEAYTDEAATLAHKETPHYQAWKGAVEAMMAEPRSSVSYIPVAPEGPAGWSSD